MHIHMYVHPSFEHHHKLLPQMNGPPNVGPRPLSIYDPLCSRRSVSDPSNLSGPVTPVGLPLLSSHHGFSVLPTKSHIHQLDCISFFFLNHPSTLNTRQDKLVPPLSLCLFFLSVCLVAWLVQGKRASAGERAPGRGSSSSVVPEILIVLFIYFFLVWELALVPSSGLLVHIGSTGSTTAETNRMCAHVCMYIHISIHTCHISHSRPCPSWLRRMTGLRTLPYLGCPCLNWKMVGRAGQVLRTIESQPIRSL